jgi:DNA repair protein SbcD/Mre11
MKKVTFIHAADLHLDSPMIGLKHLPKSVFDRLQESTFTAFSKVIDTAIQYKVDFVILAGDLFDGEDRSLRALTRFRKQVERLESYQIPVYIVHGNHDHLGGKWATIHLPKNAHIFPSEFAVKTHNNPDGVTTNLYGFSYPQKLVSEKRIDDYIKREDSDFHIGILHGQFEGNVEHGRYAPFTLSDLLEKQFDYWALGHIHKRIHLSEAPPAIYPGNIQGRHKKESGEKGCYLVTLTETNSRLEFIPCADCLWEEIVIDTSVETSTSDLYGICKKRINEIRRETEGILLTIRLHGIDLSKSQKEILESGELLETLQEEEIEEGTSFVWPIEILFEETAEWEREQLLPEADFYEDLFRAVDTYSNADECLSSLYRHSTARKFITPLGSDEKEQIVKEAEKLLIQLLKNE